MTSSPTCDPAPTQPFTERERWLIKITCGTISETMHGLSPRLKKAVVSNLVAFYGSLEALAEVEQGTPGNYSQRQPKRRGRGNKRWKVF